MRPPLGVIIIAGIIIGLLFSPIMMMLIDWYYDM